ncbi:MAG TPA: dTMP kinase [Blastocatellia bacterium]|nr:dTMP kinase [Blastocatellia bacterium]
MTGLFITMEGIDGCGKSTQMKLLAEAFLARGVEPLVTREPGGTPLGEAVRKLLTSELSLNIAPPAELFLIAGARAQHVAEVIRPALEQGRIVISDRYTDSTVAFQGHGRGLDLELISRVNDLATGGLRPHLTLVIDLEPQLARQRLNARPVGGLLGALDDEELEFHERVRQAYFGLAAADPDRVRIIDASGGVEDTHRLVMSVVEKKF